MENKDNMAQKLIYWMTGVPGLGAVRIRRIYEACDTIEALYNIEGSRLEELQILRKKEAAQWNLSMKTRENAFKQFERLGQDGIRFITPLDQDYPVRLRHLPDYPMGLYVKGRLPSDNHPSAAIIGARACTSLGRTEAETIAAVLAREGVQIISGLADGIDGAGHRGALREGQDTYGILGCGINICYPSEHYLLYEQMIKNGGVISEYPPGTAPKRQHFPMRNRLISGLADAIVVIEARERSGSLITVELGLEQGKEIFAVPGRISDSLSGGCNQLIKQGANIITSPYDILDYFGLRQEKMLSVHKFHEKSLAGKEKIVYSCLSLQPKHFDKIIAASGLTVGECMESLLELELQGLVIQTAGQYYGIKNK